MPYSQQPTASGRIPPRVKPQPPPPPPPPPAPKPGRVATPVQEGSPAATPDPSAAPTAAPAASPAPAQSNPAEPPLVTATVDDDIPIDTAEEPVNSQAPATSKARGVDLAEIDRYLEGLNKL
jgi:protein TonB